MSCVSLTNKLEIFRETDSLSLSLSLSLFLSSPLPPQFLLPSYADTYRLRLVADLGEGGLFGATREQLGPTNQRQILADLVVRVALHRLQRRVDNTTGVSRSDNTQGRVTEWRGRASDTMIAFGQSRLQIHSILLLGRTKLSPRRESNGQMGSNRELFS